jgi:hypothetical protein
MKKIDIINKPKKGDEEDINSDKEFKKLKR